MSFLGVQAQASSREAVSFSTDDVVEVPLLVPAWQVEALEALAHAHGLTAGEMVRHLLSEFLTQSSQQ
ncbi:MAG: hypothetical protein HYS12_21545 [Planctomycetes bacterium]|nr:hypothetical protein [Planctomycetota bacterium]